MEQIEVGASSLSLSIERGLDQTHADYIGDPPTEVADLVDETLMSAETVAKVTGRITQDWESDTAQSNRVDSHVLSDHLIEVLDAWKPYI